MADAAVPAQGLTKYPELDRAAVKAEMEQARPSISDTTSASSP